jgi:hypothetical protein
MSTPLIYKQLSLVMSEIGSVGKNQKNTAQGFKFRGIDDMVNNLYPALVKHKVFIAPKCVSETHEIREVERSSGKKGHDKHVSIQMCYTFWAEDGSCVEVGPIPAEGLDSGDKATNKALSAALKYALIQTFSIPTQDMEDGDSVTPVIETSKTNVTHLPPVAAQATAEATVEKKSTSSFKKPKPVEAKEEVKAAGDWQ